SEEVYTVSSTLLIKDEQIGEVSSELANIFPSTRTFTNQQNLKNEIGILKSYSLNYKAMKELREFHVDYIGVGKRGFVESRMYNKCPFVVLYDSLEKQTLGQKVQIRILPDQRYRLEINGDKNFVVEKAFGERFSEMGFN